MFNVQSKTDRSQFSLLHEPNSKVNGKKEKENHWALKSNGKTERNRWVVSLMGEAVSMLRRICGKGKVSFEPGVKRVEQWTVSVVMMGEMSLRVWDEKCVKKKD